MRLLGPEHLLTLASLEARAGMHYMSGELEFARQAQEQVLAVRARLLGAEHADTLRVSQALGQTLARMAEAEQLGPLALPGVPGQRSAQDQPGLYGVVAPAMQSTPLAAALQPMPAKPPAPPAPSVPARHGRQREAARPASMPAEPGGGPAARVPGVEQEVQAYYEEPYSLQRAGTPREQPQPEISPEPGA